MGDERCVACYFRTALKECRRYPPLRGRLDHELYTRSGGYERVYPMVSDRDWCGEYKPLTAIQRTA